MSLAVVMVVAQRLGFPQFLLVSLGAFVLINGARHAVTSIKQVTYSPGLVTGLLVFIPLGVFTLVRLEPNMSRLRFGLAVGAGLSMQVGASFMGHRARQFVGRRKLKE